MRKLLGFAAAVLFVETMFFAALAPLLPGFASEFALQKWQSGVLVSAYGLATGIFAIPAGVMASRVGVKRTAILGLVLLAATSVAFGVVDGYWPLVMTRFGQGIAATLCWTGALAWLIAASPRERRGELIGGAMSAAVGGALLGPILGGAASHFGRPVAFSTVAAVTLALALFVAILPHAPQSTRQPARVLVGALHRGDVRLGLWMLVLPSLLFGTLSVLGPLQLDRLGFGVVGVAGTFLVAGAIEAAANPFAGRWSDRVGSRTPMRTGLACSTVICLTIPWIGDRWLLAVVIVVTGAATLSLLWTPAMTMLSHGWERAGVDHGLGFALLNLGFALGHVVGSVAGGALGGAASDQVAWGLIAALCAGTLLVLRPRPAAASNLTPQTSDLTSHQP